MVMEEQSLHIYIYIYIYIYIATDILHVHSIDSLAILMYIEIFEQNIC